FNNKRASSSELEYEALQVPAIDLTLPLAQTILELSYVQTMIPTECIVPLNVF
ncbi:MAG: hypothetical protein EZS28_031527, partial [Streblomastix strix]